MKGLRLTIEITADDGLALGEAIQAVVDKIGTGTTDTASATDEWFYRYTLENHGSIDE
jgi:hypothetical protein